MLLEMLLAGAAIWLFKSSGTKTQNPNKISTPIASPPRTCQSDFSAVDATKRKIVEAARTRRIEYLCHFTRKENLSSIQKYGLLSRQKLENAAMSFQSNDDQRFDGYRNSVSLSVTFPNYKMFWSLRQKNKSTQWAVILLDACKVLQYCECAFQRTNAASNKVRHVPIESRKTFESFDDMFYDENTRRARNLRDNETTDPQAEILCFDGIPPEFIKDIKYSGEYLDPRHDWSYWKKSVGE